ncbi:unnamed protein product [Didymodactylos carnosus]|uniref:Tesmin/TSO1-like CXC domain-containing protein n=1 Tax=Didymodactylos carnosus TaxID=1234261 RepID=A0A8S2RCN0_9BILA|nr:unnamed protein product [Didymodactylos carnosus]CAF4153117.1 unnamed protein product [Didymodactylos carnosus]
MSRIISEYFSQSATSKSFIKRHANQKLNTYQLSKNTQLPFTRDEYDKFIKENRALLALQVRDAWLKMHPMIPPGKLFYVGGPDEDCYTLTKNICTKDLLLSSNHIEFDTRVFVHIQNVSDYNLYNNVIIESADTDVLLLSIAYSLDFDGLDMIIDRTTNTQKTKQQKKYVHCTPIAKYFSSCDKELLEFEQTLLTDKAVTSAEKLIIQCYKCIATTLDEARVHQAKKVVNGTSLSKSFLQQLPPTSDGFRQHLLRAHLQTRIWLQAREPYIQYPLLDGNGYIETSNGVQIKWTTNTTFPKLTGCRCTSNCKNCGCKYSSCTILCRCDPETCINRQSQIAVNKQQQSKRKSTSPPTQHRTIRRNTNTRITKMFIRDILDQSEMEEDISSQTAEETSSNEGITTDDDEEEIEENILYEDTQSTLLDMDQQNANGSSLSFSTMYDHNYARRI